MLRVKKLELRLYTGWEGFLLKRMREGDIPDDTNLAIAVTDPLTGEIITTQSTLTYGTEFVGGFFEPVEFRIDITPESWNPKRDGQQRGTIDPDLIHGVCPAFPRITKHDIFVHQHSDRRFEIDSVKTLTQHRGVPVFCSVGLRQIPSTDVIYALGVSE
jgi:hypothetical protein